MSLSATYTVALSAAAPNDDRKAWVHLLPLGTFAARDGRGPWTLSDPAAVIAASWQRSPAGSLPVDYDHQIENAQKNGQPAPAAGWITALADREDGIWGLVEWTTRAAEHLAKREYRFISPVFTHAPADQGGEVLSILRAGLTNVPALELTALARDEQMTANTIPAELLSLLNLTETADMGAVIEAVKSLITTAAAERATPDRFVPMAVFEKVTAELNRASKGLSTEAAEIAVSREISAGRLIPALKEWGIELCQTSKPAFDGFVERTAGSLQHLLVETRRGLPPGARGGASDAESEIARNLGHDPADLI